jgi:hypothetical protein
VMVVSTGTSKRRRMTRKIREKERTRRLLNRAPNIRSKTLVKMR